MCMKVILLKDVAKIGRRHQIVEVPDGFALNKLIPRKEAEPATAANVRRVEERNKSSQAISSSEASHITKLESETTATPLLVPMEANEQGHLFQSVHYADLKAALALRQLSVPESHVVFTSPIKSVGEHMVTLEAGGVTKQLHISVTPKAK